MIINTGQRTDIPAFYSEWFANRLREGFVLVRNPYNPLSVTKYRLSPDVVDLICFCTKNPAPMLPRMGLLAPYGQLWHVTVTPYGRKIEPRVPSVSAALDSFRRLSDMLGPKRVVWRYDPIFISPEYTLERHAEAFDAMARALEGFTDVAVISFIDLYEKTKRNFPEARSVTGAQRLRLGELLVDAARRHGMTLRPCAEGDALGRFGADCSGCMTVADCERALGCRLKVPRFTPAREGCACYLGGDIGAYNTCGHLCKYCYANHDAATVAANLRAHDPNSPLLVGHLTPDDRVHDARQRSWKDGQLRMAL